MADRYLLESGSPDGYLLEDGSGVALLNASAYRDAVMTDSPVAYWRLGEASGTVAVDAVGSNNGTYVASPTLGVTGPLSGDADTGITVTGASSQYISIPDSNSLDVGDVFSIELWFKRSATQGTNQTLIHKGASAPVLGFDTSNVPTFAISGIANLRKAPAVTDQNWHHLVATKNGATKFLYLDGVEGNNDVGSGTGASNALALNIGRDNSGVEYFSGSLDEVAYYNVALTSTQVNNHYTASLTSSITVTPGVASLTTATFAPQVNLAVIPPAASLSLTTFAPVIKLSVVPATASLSLTTFAPTVPVSNNQLVIPDTATLTTSAFAPTVTASDHKTVVPGVAALSLTTFAPSVTVGINVVPATAGLTTSTFAPTVTASDHKVVVPGVLGLSTATFAPVIQLSVIPPTASLSLTAYAPVIKLTVIPATATLSLATFAPTVSAPRLVVPATATLSLTAFLPTVTASDHKTVVPDVAALSMTAFAPGVVASDHKVAVPATAGLLLTGYAPVISTTVPPPWTVTPDNIVQTGHGYPSWQ